MDPLTWGFIGTLIGTIVGASASILTTIINAKNSNKNLSDLENYKRLELLREFQRSNCLKLQEILSKAFRLVAILLLEDIKNYKITGEWQKSKLNSQSDMDFMFALRDLSIYYERIQDEDLRQELKNIKVKMSTVLMTSNISESNNIMLDLTNEFEKIMTVLGVELRKNY
jgi:hypothetical protein